MRTPCERDLFGLNASYTLLGRSATLKSGVGHRGWRGEAINSGGVAIRLNNAMRTPCERDLFGLNASYTLLGRSATLKSGVGHRGYQGEAINSGGVAIRLNIIMLMLNHCE
jgi:hypothetical protein